MARKKAKRYGGMRRSVSYGWLALGAVAVGGLGYWMWKRSQEAVASALPPSPLQSTADTAASQPAYVPFIPPTPQVQIPLKSADDTEPIWAPPIASA